MNINFHCTKFRQTLFKCWKSKDYSNGLRKAEVKSTELWLLINFPTQKLTRNGVLVTLFKSDWNSFHLYSKIYLTLMQTSASCELISELMESNIYFCSTLGLNLSQSSRINHLILPSDYQEKCKLLVHRYIYKIR